MARFSTELEEHKTQLQADLSGLEDDLQRRKDKDQLRVGNMLKTLSREINDWEKEAREADESDESTQRYLMEKARELRSKLVKIRST